MIPERHCNRQKQSLYLYFAFTSGFSLVTRFYVGQENKVSVKFHFSMKKLSLIEAEVSLMALATFA